MWKYIINNALSCNASEISLQINKSLISNCHSTWCHWPPTLQWGWFDWPHLLIHIHCHTKVLPSYPKLTLKNLLRYYTMNYVHHSLAYLVFHLNKNRLIKNATKTKSFKCMQSQKLSHIVQKILSLQIIRCKLKKNMINRFLASQKSRAFLEPTPLNMPTQLFKEPMGSWTKLIKWSRCGSFYVL